METILFMLRIYKKMLALHLCLTIYNHFMKQIITFLCALTLLMSACSGDGVIEMREYGIVPNTGENLSQKMQEALTDIKQKDGEKKLTLLFETGRYDFYPEGAASKEYYISNHDQPNPKPVGLALEDWKNLTLDGGNADFIFHGRMLPISLVRSVNADIHAYEASAKLFPEDLNSTNSESSIRAMAAEKVYNSMENRFTVDVLEALAQYDDTEMEIGSANTPFTVKTIDELNLLAGNNNWGMADRYLLLPFEAQYTLMQDEKFYEIWSLTNGKALVDNVGKSGDADNMLRWTPYRGFMIGFMAKKQANNKVGLPIAEDGSILGFAWKRSRVGFGMNDTLQSRIFQDLTKEGNPLVFKTNGSSGAAIIDKTGVIGIKIDATPLQ